MSDNTYYSLTAFGALLPGIALVVIASACWRLLKLSGVGWFGAAAAFGLVSFVALAFPATGMIVEYRLPLLSLPERLGKILHEMRIYEPSVLFLFLVCFGFAVLRFRRSLPAEKRGE